MAYNEKLADRVRELGIGTLFSNRSTNMGLYVLSQDDWAFALQPEAGYLVNMSQGVDAMISAKYNVGFATSDRAAQSYLTVNLGFLFNGR